MEIVVILQARELDGGDGGAMGSSDLGRVAGEGERSSGIHALSSRVTQVIRRSCGRKDGLTQVESK